MLESLPVIIVIGTLLGFLSGLGIGGGSLLIVWLTGILHMDALTAKSINLMFFVPSALIACIIRYKNGQLKLQIPLYGMVSGCIFAILGNWLSTQLDTAIIKKLFGIILIVTGSKELLYRERNER